MANPIKFGLVLEGEDAKTFFENQNAPPTKPQNKLFKEAELMSKRIRF